MIKAGTSVGLAASLLAGCSWPQSSTRSGTSSAALPDRSSNLPVATQPRSSESRPPTHPVGVGTSRTTDASVGGGGGGLVIDSGVRTTSEGAKRAVMPDEMAASLLETATVLELRGNLEAAKQHYERALSISPNDPKLLVSYARFADRHGQGSVAADLYQRVLESESSHPLLWSEAGLSLTRNGRADAGVAACRKAAAAVPDNQRVLANLSEAESVVRQFRDGESRLADAGVNSRRPTDRDPTSAMTVSSSLPGTSPADSRSTPTYPFSPGSTARQFERRLPPVVSSRRLPSAIEQPERGEVQNERSFVPPTELEASETEIPATPVNTNDFLPAAHATSAFLPRND